MLRRRISTFTAVKSTSSSASSVSALHIISSPLFVHHHHVESKHHIHERLPRVKSYVADEKIDAAKSALIQLNVMVSQGIEPDAQMYTSLILIMGRAKLEWQAFKLFSRMLEQGVQPLPETYLALKRATDPKRVKMIEKIESKMAEMNDLLPEQVSNQFASEIEKNNRAAERQMRELKSPSKLVLSGDDVDPSSKVEQKGAAAAATDTTTAQKDASNGNGNKLMMDDDNIEDHYLPSTSEAQIRQNRDRQLRNEKISEMWKQGQQVPTMKINSLEGVMATIENIDKRNAHAQSLATGARRTKIKDELLAKMHEEELKIILSIHRQSRHGNKEQLITRILAQVPADYLEATLDRRSHYFSSVKQVLELQIDELKSIQENEEAMKKRKRDSEGKNDDSDANIEEDDEMMRDIIQSIDIRSKIKDSLSSSSKNLMKTDDANKNNKGLLSSVLDENNNNNDGSSNNTPIRPKGATELTPQEKYNMSPAHLEAPWGLMRKPIRPPPNPAAPNPERDEKQKLNQRELVELQNSLVAGTLDQIPQRLLRRYCRHFHLKWSRNAGSAALQDIVEWHLRTFKPRNVDDHDDQGRNLTCTTTSSTTSSEIIDQTSSSKEKDLELEAYDAAEEERRAQQQTLDQYNALVAVARITDNMKLVDDAQISKTVFDRQQAIRLDRKRQQQESESDKWTKRLSDLNENMRKMPPGYAQKQQQSGNKKNGPEDFRTQDVFARTGEAPSTRILGVEEISQTKARSNEDILNEQLIASSLKNENLQETRNTFRNRFDKEELERDAGDEQQQRQQYGARNSRSTASSSSNIRQQQQQNTNNNTNNKLAQEIPPWEASASSSANAAPFNLRTGRFDIGVPDAEYYEDASGRLKVRRPHALKQNFRVDEDLLPAPQQSRIQREKAEDEDFSKGEQRDQEMRRGKFHPKAQKFKKFMEKAKEKAKRAREEQYGGAQPITQNSRMSMRLKRNPMDPAKWVDNKKVAAPTYQKRGGEDKTWDE